MGEVAVWADEINWIAEFGFFEPRAAAAFGDVFDAEGELIGVCWR